MSMGITIEFSRSDLNLFTNFGSASAAASVPYSSMVATALASPMPGMPGMGGPGGMQPGSRGYMGAQQKKKKKMKMKIMI